MLQCSIKGGAAVGAVGRLAVCVIQRTGGRLAAVYAAATTTITTAAAVGVATQHELGGGVAVLQGSNRLNPASRINCSGTWVLRMMQSASMVCACRHGFAIVAPGHAALRTLMRQTPAAAAAPLLSSHTTTTLSLSLQMPVIRLRLMFVLLVFERVLLVSGCTAWPTAVQTRLSTCTQQSAGAGMVWLIGLGESSAAGRRTHGSPLHNALPKQARCAHPQRKYVEILSMTGCLRAPCSHEDAVGCFGPPAFECACDMDCRQHRCMRCPHGTIMIIYIYLQTTARRSHLVLQRSAAAAAACWLRSSE